jgi:hypothetical protein
MLADMFGGISLAASKGKRWKMKESDKTVVCGCFDNSAAIRGIK